MSTALSIAAAAIQDCDWYFQFADAPGYYERGLASFRAAMAALRACVAAGFEPEARALWRQHCPDSTMFSFPGDKVPMCAAAAAATNKEIDMPQQTLKDIETALPERPATPEPVAAPTTVVNNAPTGTDLVPANAKPGGALAIIPEAFAGALDTLQESGLSGALALININEADKHLGGNLPQIKIMQAMTEGAGEIAPVGSLFHTITGDHWTELTLTLLAKKWGMQWAAPFEPKKGLRLYCEASDGLARDIGNEDTCDNGQHAPEFGTLCRECPHNNRQECGDLFTVMLYAHEIEEPALWFVRSTAIRALRRANTMAKAYGDRAWRAKGLPAANAQPNLLVQFRLTTEKTTNDKGTFYVPIVSDFKVIEDEAIQTGILQAVSMFGRMFAAAKGSELQKASEKKPEPWDDEGSGGVRSTVAVTGGFNGRSQDDGDPGPSDDEVGKF